MRWVVHATDLLLRLWRFVQCCATHSTGADTARWCHLRVSRRPAVALQPKSYNQRGTYLGCLGATGWEKWSLASLGIKVRLCHVPCAQVHCLMEYEIVQPGVKWTATIIVKYCWRRSCCHASRNIGWQFQIPTGQRTCREGAIDQWREWLTTDISSFTR